MPLLLVGIWLSVNNTSAPGHIVLGGILAILIPVVTSAFWPESVRLQSPWLIVKYAFRLGLDILTANLPVAVAVWIVRPNQQLQPAFVRYELALRSPLVISVLANIISLTPGTVSCDLSADQRFLLIHSLHTKGADILGRQIHRWTQIIRG